MKPNDRASINANKNFYSFVIEAGGYDKLTFEEKDCQKYLEKVRRLRLGMGDAKTICNYGKMIPKNTKFFYVMELTRNFKYEMCFEQTLEVGNGTNHLRMLLPLTRHT